MMLVLEETVDGQRQGGVVPLPLEFESGLIRGRVRPDDGQVYVGGLAGWVTNAARNGCLQRVRYTGVPATCRRNCILSRGRFARFLPAARPLDRRGSDQLRRAAVELSLVDRPTALPISKFRSRRPKGTTSSKSIRSPFSPTSARSSWRLTPCNRSCRSRSALRCGRGRKADRLGRLWNDPRARAAAQRLAIVAAAHRPGQLDEQQKAALAPGLKVRVLAKLLGGQAAHDTRALRVPAWHVRKGSPPAVFLAPGPFTAAAEGYLRAELKGKYRFSSQGRGPPAFRSTIAQSSPTKTSRPAATHRSMSFCKRATTGCNSTMPAQPTATPRCGCFGAAISLSRNWCRPRLSCTTPPIRICSPHASNAQAATCCRRAAVQTAMSCRAN